jgi:hypothetical protein
VHTWDPKPKTGGRALDSFIMAWKSEWPFVQREHHHWENTEQSWDRHSWRSGVSKHREEPCSSFKAQGLDDGLQYVQQRLPPCRSEFADFIGSSVWLCSSSKWSNVERAPTVYAIDSNSTKNPT